MTTISCALALLSGVIGAGFASGREIAHFFAAHGLAAPLAALCACAALLALICLLPAQMERAGVSSLDALCRAQLGARFGRLCAGLFFLLFAVTGGAMLAACAELAALLLPIRHSYGVGLLASLLLGALLCRCRLHGLALPGALLTAGLPVLLIRLLALPAGEACFSPVRSAVRAAGSGLSYGALSAAQLAGTLPLLLPLRRRQRRHAAMLFALLFGALLLLGVAVLRRHRQAALFQRLPFVYLCRSLGRAGYLLCAFCLYAAALSTLCAMLAALRPLLRTGSVWPGALCCLVLARMGFGTLIARGYPALGALCAALLLLLCLPCRAPQKVSSSSR